MSRSNPLSAEFGDYVARLMKKWRVPSLTIAIVDGEEVHSADIRLAAAATPETLYYVGSTTKSFVAAALTLLADDGLLKLTDPLRTHIPGFEMNTRAATLDTSIEDALCHRSGLPTHDQVYGCRDQDGNEKYTIQDLLKALPHLPLTAEPRTKYQYTNIMFMLATLVVENVSGMSFEDFLKKRILSPLQMNSTYLSLRAVQAAVKQENKHLAPGYFWDDESQSYMPERHLDSPFASGAFHMVSNVLEFAKYLKAMINETPPISKTGYRELRTPRSIQPPVEVGGPYAGPLTYALGWQHAVYNGENVFSHGGGVCGFGTLMCYIPSLKWGVAMMGNTEIRANALEEILWHRLMDDRLSIPQERRSNFEEYWDAKHKKDYHDSFYESPKRLYPDAIWTGPPSELKFPETFTGDFEHPGYGTFTLSSIESPKFRYPNAKEGPILCTSTGDRTWPFQMQFQPVNGLHFHIWKLPLGDNPTLLFKGALKAEFHVNGKNEIDMLGIDFFEEEGNTTWFKKKTKS